MCQLQAEKSAGDDVIVWQSKPFSVRLAETIAADEAIEAASLPYLQELDARVAANAQRAEDAANRAGQGGGGSGVVGEIVVENVRGLRAALDEKAPASEFSGHATDISNPHKVTAGQTGAAEKTHAHEMSEIRVLQTALERKAEDSAMREHLADHDNPHGVTPAQIGAAAEAHGHAASEIAGLQEMLAAGMLKAGGIYDAETNYQPLTLVRGERATYLSIAASTGVPLSDAGYWQLVVRDGADAGGTEEPDPIEPDPVIEYIANYALSGTAGDPAPEIIADTSGNGNDMATNNIGAYDGSGLLPITGANAWLHIPAIDFGGAIAYTMHIKMGTGAWNSQHRIFHIPSNDMHFMLVNANGNTAIKYESAHEDPGFVSPVTTGSFAPTLARMSIREYEMTIALDGDTVAFDATARDAGGNSYHLSETQTIVGFTAHLAQGVYFGNRTDGTRPIGVAIRELWITKGRKA